MNFDNCLDEQTISYFQSGNEDAIDFILNKYRTLVNSVARRYFLIGAEQEDLIQEGMIGLYKACVSFKNNAKTRFKTFAYLCINRSIQSAIKLANKKNNILLNNAISLNKQSGISLHNSQHITEDESVIFLPSPELTPENKLIEEENYKERLQQIKNLLSNYEYEVLKQYLLGYRCDDIAQTLHKDYKSIDNAINRIKNKLNFLNK